MNRPIAISLSPNTEPDDVKKALSLILKPRSWTNGEIVSKLENKFANLFDKEYKAFALRSGRESLYLILKTLGIGKGDEVILQAFTCSAAVNPIIWRGAKPVYADIGKDYNIDPTNLEQKITKNTKALIVQHTFGIPAEIEKIVNIAKQHNLYLIEDCAVSLGADVDGVSVGKFGDISFFSFGRDKIISSVWGGMILAKDEKHIKYLNKLVNQIDYPSNYWIFQQLLHPVAFSIILPLYNFGYRKFTLGKMTLFLLQKLNLLSKPITKQEKTTDMPADLIKKMPAAQATLVSHQLNKLDKFNNRRKEIAAKYFQSFGEIENIVLPSWNSGAVWLRYPIKVADAKDLLNFAKKRGIMLGDWYKEPIYPIDNLSLVSYYANECPQVEKLNNKIVNLPTYPLMNESDVDEVIRLIKQWIKFK